MNETLTIQDGITLYLQDRDLASNTKYAHRKRLQRFEEWCAGEGIEDLDQIGARVCYRYKIEEFAEKEDGQEYSKETVRGYIDTLRVFLRFCESIDAVEEGTSEKIESPRPNLSRDIVIEEERGKEILEYLNRFEYASLNHVLFRLIWEIGGRIGTIRGIDVNDLDLDNGHIELHHRPDTGTELKNGISGERDVAISRVLSRILEDNLDHHRVESEDDHGREPLLSTKFGRAARTTLRNRIYAITRPCMMVECPHGEDPEDCHAAQNRQKASQCPSTVSPHPLRRTAITRHLREDVPIEIVSDRFDVSHKVLDEHYDVRSRREKMEQRRNYLPD